MKNQSTSCRIQKWVESVLRSLWPATRQDTKKVLAELRGCRQLLLDQHLPGNRLVTDLVAALRSGNPGNIPPITYNFERVCRDIILDGKREHPGDFCVAAVALGDDYRRQVEPCLRTHRDYCAKHGLDYHLLTQAPAGFFHRGERHSSWGKIILLHRLLDEGYRHILYLDADLAITNDTISPKEIVTMFQGPEPDLLVSDEGVHFNCGLVLARKTLTTQALLNAIWINEKYRNNGAWEQDSLLDLIVEHPEIRRKLQIEEPRRLQSLPPEYGRKYDMPDRYLWQPGDFSIHFAHTKRAELDAMMAKYVPKKA